ncbi:MAG: UDP-N-acetylmuramate dehydrogenase [Apibacter sp.]|nr:UDP-N-acetylmuramate dehydrogenase [Apibacter sp.]
MIIQENIDIKKFTTFHVSAICRFFTETFTLEELNEALNFSVNNKLPVLFIGGGSNILFINKAFNGLVIKVNLKGIQETLGNHNNQVFVSGMAGENWDSFVSYCINKNYGGLENLSLIPGNVGTSPIQNIGAYGVEMKDSFYQLKALNLTTREIEIFSFDDCNFGYRESFFKNEGKNNYVILEVTFQLTTKKHTLKLSYGDIMDEHNKDKISEPSLKEIRNQIIAIRKRKLPDPEVLGNAGSFFKNPIIPIYQLIKIQENYPNIPFYTISNDFVKLPAAWLIEKTGWKGKKMGNVGVHEKQPLVLVNLGTATGKEIFSLSNSIIEDVNKIFNIQLEREVNIIL